MSAGSGPAEPESQGLPGPPVFRVEASGAHGVLIGDGSTQVNNFVFEGTWTDGVVALPLAEKSGKVESPYRGLRSFGEADAAFFFGRDAAIDDIRARLTKCLVGDGLLVVSGVSGAGKTSLLRAGLLRELRRAGLPAVTDADPPSPRDGGLPAVPEAATWPCVVLVPGSRPLDQLAARIAPAARLDAASIKQSLTVNPADFALTAAQAATPDGTTRAAGERRLLLIVDQFETVFTQCESEDERWRFVTALHAAATAGAAAVVIGIRADLEPRLADYAALADCPALATATQHRYLLTAMTERQLRLAIGQPAAKLRSSVDEDLIEQLLREVRTQAGQPGTDQSGAGPQLIGAGVLPLLSHALDQAWRGRDAIVKARKDPLTLADYERTGGIEGAVRGSADRVYNGLTTSQQMAARQVFTRLTATTPDGIDTAVRLPRDDLLAGKDESTAADVVTVLDKFTEERLLTLAAETVEISHEVLLSAWPLLRDNWLAVTRADRAARTQLQATVSDWHRSLRDPSFLYTGSRLELAEQAAARIQADPARHTRLSKDERAFLWASRQAARRAARIRRRVVVGIGVLAAGLAVALVIATVSAGNLLSERNAATSAQRSAERDLAAQAALDFASKSLPLASTDPLTAAEDSVLAWGLAPGSAQARYALLTAAASPLTAVFTGHFEPLSLAFSPDGKTLAVGGQGEDLVGAQLWNTVTDKEAVTDKRADGQLAIADTAGSTTSSSPLTHVVPVAFSPDGKILTVADSTIVARWNAASQRKTTVFSAESVGGIESLAQSPDGKTLAIGGLLCACVQLRNAATGQQIGAPLSLFRRGLLGANVLAAFSPDGKTIATAGPDNTVRLWNTATRQHEDPAFPTLASAIHSLTFSPNGKILATREVDGTVRLWDVTTGRQLGQALIAGKTDGTLINTVAFGPGGSLIAAGDKNGTVRVWDVATRHQIGPVLSGGTDAVNAVAFSPDGTTLASADDDDSVRLWSLATLTGQQAGPPVPAGSGISAGGYGSVALGPSGMLATSDSADEVTIWRAAHGEQNGYPSFAVPNPPSSVGSGPPDVALSPDGKTLVTGADNGTIRLWNLPSGLLAGTPEKTIPLPSSVGSPIPPQRIAFSPDGKEFAAAYADGTVEVLDTATGQPVVAPSRVAGQTTGFFLALGFVQGDSAVITVSSTGDVVTWNLQTHVATPSHLAYITGQSAGVAFSPDGTTVAVGGNDGTVQFWDYDTGQQIGDPITTGDGALDLMAFSPGGTTLATGGTDGTVRLWDVARLTPAAAFAQLCARIRPPILKLGTWSTLQPGGVSYQRACARD